MANFAFRVNVQAKLISGLRFHGKLNGAVGNFNAHMFAYPDTNWSVESRQFIQVLLMIKVQESWTRLQPIYNSN
jgi:adenylosuccinate lyase